MNVEQEKLEAAIEMAHCALVNLSQAMAVAGKLANPLFDVARWQLTEALEMLGRKP